MRLKIIMDSGKEYEVTSNKRTVQDFIDTFYDKIPGNMGVGVMKNSIMRLGGGKTLFNPTHVSSVEIIED